jgi:transposase
VLFVEQIPAIIGRYTRKTKRLKEKQRKVAFLLGGGPGKRVAHLFHVAISVYQLLRVNEVTEKQPIPRPRVLGIDDWALCKGHSYGTILFDLETDQVVALLPDRKTETVTRWLQEHPGVEIISRDRGQEYIWDFESRHQRDRNC